MTPYIIIADSFLLSTYVIFLSLAFLSGLLVLVFLRNIYHPDIRISPFIVVPVFICSLVGARSFWILQYDKLENIWQAFAFWEGGWVFYGGFLGGLVAAIAYFRVGRTRVLGGLDLLAAPLALGISITRVGCFLSGCCWGRPTNVAWAVSFPMKLTPVVLSHYFQGMIASDSTSTIPLHPVQICNALLKLVLFFICLLALPRKQYDGQVFLLFLCGYGLFRFVTEFFRGDSPHVYLGLTLSQAISAALFLGAGCVLIAMTRIKKDKRCNE